MLMSFATLAPAAWYFMSHFETVKYMGASIFSSKVKNFAMFGWFGYLPALVINFKGKPNIALFVVFATSMAGLIYYFIATRSFSREAKENPSLHIPKTAKMIVMAVVLGLSVVIGIVA